MSKGRRDPQETWRAFFAEACREEVRQLVDAYPRERSLYVDVLDLYEFDGEFTTSLFDDPDRYLAAGATALQDLADPLDRVNIRLINHPGLLGIEGLRSRHIAELVTVEGITAEVADVQSALETAVYRCRHCDETVTQRIGRLSGAPGSCPACGTTDALELDAERSTYVDVQRLILDSPRDGRSDDGPLSSIDAIVDDDLVGTVNAGERLLATGIVRLEPAATPNWYDFYLDVVSLDEEPGEMPAPGEDISGELQEAIQSRWELLTDG